MKNILRVIAIGLTLTINSVAAVPAGAQCTALVPSNDCSPGGGSKTTDCQMEWRFTPMPKKLVNATPTPDVFRGRPRNRIICYEGDPRCDFDPNLTNHSCTMRTEIFINNQDPNLTSCSSASGIAIFEVKRPNPASASLDAADTANIQTLENQAGSGGFGVTVVRKRTPVQTGNPNTTQNLGSPPLDLIVPQPQRSDLSYTTGNKRVRIQSSNQLEKRDPDSLLLTCRISTCGNNIIETDHELCDDGNRTNGDGCNQACQTEVVIGTPTNTATITPTQTPAETPTVTNTPVQTATNTHTNTPANTATAGNTFTQSPTRTPSSTPTATNTPQSTGTQTPTRTPTLTPTITNTPLGTSTQTPTRTLTTTPTQTPTGAATPTATAGAAIGLHAFNILPGKPLCRGTCVGGPVPGRRCQLSSGAFGCGGGTCQSKICYGGATPGATCAFDGACGATDGCQMAPPVGSCAIVQGDILPATRVPLLGNLMLDIGAPDGNGVATVTIPAANTVLDAASVPGIGFVCVLQGTDGTGIIDCNGGATNIDTLLELDHNTATAGVCMRGSNAGGACASDAQCPGASTTGACNLFNSGSANGLPDDPTCTASLLQPDSSLSVACPEGERVCVGGTKQGFPCVGGTDCPGSTCSATQCGSGVNVGMACADDSNCPAGRCATFVCRGGSNNGNFCTLDTDCPTGVCIPCSSNDTVTGHTGVCSSPTKITQSGTFAAGGLQVAMPLAIQILATDGSENGPDALPCTGDDTPEGPPAPVTVVLSTGVTTIKIYDANNQNNNKIAPGELCAGSPCGTQLTGTPFSCATLATSVTAGGTLGGGFPAVDTLASDIATTFQFVSQ